MGAGNWVDLGMWAWLLFRISGLVVAVYSFAHILVVFQGRTRGGVALDEVFSL